MIRPTEKERELGRKYGWNEEEVKRGYSIFNFNGLNMYEVEQINDMDTFERFREEHNLDIDADTLAAIQAELDGVCKIIPINELPNPFVIDGTFRRFYGWVDTPENREAIRRYCESNNY